MSISWAVLAAGAARADVVISSNPTQNMACKGGVCAPTMPGAVLNVADLATLLAVGSVTVTTTSAGVQAGDIRLAAPLTWAAATTLTLDAHASVAINNLVQVAGAGGVALMVNDGGRFGALSFGKRGHVVFKNLVGTLRIGGTAYVLVTSVLGLSAAIAKNPAGAYALAGDYDASGDGTYPASPVATTFTGSFSGLGNTIHRLSITDRTVQDNVGLFAKLGAGGALRNLRLDRIKVKGATYGLVGTLVGENDGSIADVAVNGSVMMIETITPEGGSVGGLVGENVGGSIVTSHTIVAVRGGNAGRYVGGLVGLMFGGAMQDVSSYGDVTGFNAEAGGLVGEVFSGSVDRAFATGAVVSNRHAGAGGLTAGNGGVIVDCYASGAVNGGNKAHIGGLAGINVRTIATSYSIGGVSGLGKSVIGGFTGMNSFKISASYWDTTTSGTGIGVGIGSAKGTAGLTTAELQSGLPVGFSFGVWAQDPGINGGLPYLLGNPPSRVEP